MKPISRILGLLSKSLVFGPGRSILLPDDPLSAGAGHIHDSIHVKATSTWKHSCRRVAWQTCLPQLRRRHRIDDTGFYIPLNIIKKARRWENVNGNVNSYYKAYVFILALEGSPDLREPAQSCGAVVSLSLGKKRLERGRQGLSRGLLAPKGWKMVMHMK